jgi:hypothetical protein
VKSKISRGGLTQFTQAQVDVFRLSRHRLSAHAPASAAAETVGAVAGLQAQVVSAAELMLWARTDGLEPGVLDRLLWEDRALVKTWGMRGTLHVLRPSQVTLIGAARGGEAPPEASWFTFFKVSRAGFDSIMEAVPAALSGQPLTRRELAEAVSQTGGPVLGQRLLSGWGEFLKPLARRGVLVHGPPRGQEATFVSTEAWLGPQRHWSVVEAGAEAVRLYLSVFGPATRADFERWLGVRPPVGRPAWQAAEPGLEMVDVAGRKLWAVRADLAQLERAEPDDQVRLLGPFDTWVLGHADRSHLFTDAERPLVSRAAGWISAVVLRGGRVGGTWTYKKGARGLEVGVELLAPLSAAGRRQLEADAERLAQFLGAPLALTVGCS